MFNKLPKMVTLAILLLKSLDLKEALKLIQEILYLWREFYIKVKIKPVIETFKVSFYYKDTRLIGTDIKDIKELSKLIENIKRSRID